MKKIIQQLSVLFLLLAVMTNCEDEEMRFVDPMINGICENTDAVITQINNSGSWNNSLIDFKAQRLKMLNIKMLIETDGYNGDNYSLESKEMSLQRVNEVLQDVEFKIDSVWDANVQNDFNAINENSAGIQAFGSKTYAATSTEITNASAWLMSEEKEVPGEEEYIANDLVDIQTTVVVLADLAALNEDEVNQFVQDINDQYALMLQQYADLATEVATSPYFSNAQKELYASLETPLEEIGTTIAEDLSLATKDQLDLLNRDLYSLVYFVDNNYTSPAQKPLVFGEISSITELRWLSEQSAEADWAANWNLTVDIDAAETHRWNDGTGYFAIPQMDGTFDGQFHIISGLKIGPTTTKSAFVGLLNATGTIKNLGLFNVSGTTIGGQGGIVAGQVNGGTIIKCFASGSFGGAGQSGAFIGRPDGGTFEDCFSNVHLTHIGANNLGGFFGTATLNISMTNCYVAGLITGGASKTGSIMGNYVGDPLAVTLSGVYFDSSTTENATGSTVADLEAQITDLPTASWDNLSNLSGYSADVWEVKTLPLIDSNARPYLKGFNYDGLIDFLIPEN